MWSYCDDSKSYYPYVATCRTHWIAMPATLPDMLLSSLRPPSIPQWFYCDAAKGYFPYVRDCKQNWSITPAVPPAGAVAPPPPPPPQKLPAVP